MSEDDVEAGDLVGLDVVGVALVLASLEHDEFIRAHPLAATDDVKGARALRRDGFLHVGVAWERTVECAQSMMLMWFALEHPELVD